MRKMISFNLRSIILYTIVLILAFGIEISTILAQNPLLFLLPLIIIGIIYLGFMSLFSRCDITNDVLIIHGDDLISQESRVQKTHYIRFTDVIDYQYTYLPLYVDTNFEPVKITHRWRNRYLWMYGFRPIKCITFYLNDGTKSCFIISRYSKKQIREIEYVLIDKITRSSSNYPNTDQKPIYKGKRVSPFIAQMPPYLRIIWALMIILFLSFMIHSAYIGGDAMNGYIIGNAYYVENKHTITQVTYREWIINYYLGIASITSYAIGFPLLMVQTVLNSFLIKEVNIV